jgi:hypothetical protein
LDLLFERFSGMKKAALEKFVPKCDILSFFFKVHQVGGTMGAAMACKNTTEGYFMKISYTATQNIRNLNSSSHA